MNHITAYYQLEKLPDTIKKTWKIKSNARLDCVRFFNKLDHDPLSQFVNKKGMMYFFINNPEHYVNTNSKRKSEIGLTNGSSNLSSIYIPSLEYPEYGHGDYANDLLLFKMESDLGSIEMLLIKNAKFLKDQYFQLFIDGELDEEIEQIKQQSVPFFEYKTAA